MAGDQAGSRGSCDYEGCPISLPAGGTESRGFERKRLLDRIWLAVSEGEARSSAISSGSVRGG